MGEEEQAMEERVAEREFRFVFQARDYEDAVSFYRDTLELPTFESWDRGSDKGTLFRAAGGTVEVLAHSDELVGPLSRGAVIEVEDVDLVYRLLRERNVPIQVEIADKPWGFRQFSVVDPDGNTVMVFTRLESL